MVPWGDSSDPLGRPFWSLGGIPVIRSDGPFRLFVLFNLWTVACRRRRARCRIRFSGLACRPPFLNAEALSTMSSAIAFTVPNFRLDGDTSSSTRAYRMPDLVVSQECRRRRACRCRRACRRRRFVLLLSPTPRPLFNTLRAQCSGGAEVCCTIYIYIYIYIYGVRAHQRPKETTPVLSEPENGTANVKVLQMAVR